MSLPQGIAFRSTIAYVTDVSPDYCENSTTDTSDAGVTAATYPQTTAEGNNVGWETVLSGDILTRNRTTTSARLAGKQSGNNGSLVHEYRIDLPAAGDHVIRLASGDYTYGGSPSNIELFDTTTSLGVLASATTSAAQRFIDATNVERTSVADWASNNASVTKTFSSTILRFKMGTGSVIGSISFFHVAAAGGMYPPWYHVDVNEIVGADGS